MIQPGIGCRSAVAFEPGTPRSGERRNTTGGSVEFPDSVSPLFDDGDVRFRVHRQVRGTKEPYLSGQYSVEYAGRRTASGYSQDSFTARRRG